MINIIPILNCLAWKQLLSVSPSWEIISLFCMMGETCDGKYPDAISHWALWKSASEIVSSWIWGEIVSLHPISAKVNLRWGIFWLLCDIFANDIACELYGGEEMKLSLEYVATSPTGAYPFRYLSLEVRYIYPYWFPFTGKLNFDKGTSRIFTPHHLPRKNKET